MIVYNWPPQWKEAPVLDETQKDELVSGRVLILRDRRFRQYDLFRIGDRIAICVYSDMNGSWFRVMTPEETFYLKGKEESKMNVRFNNDTGKCDSNDFSTEAE